MFLGQQVCIGKSLPSTAENIVHVSFMFSLFKALHALVCLGKYCYSLKVGADVIFKTSVAQVSHV